MWMHWSPGGDEYNSALSSVHGNWPNKHKALDDVAVE